MAPRYCIECYSQKMTTIARVIYRDDPYCEHHVKVLGLPAEHCEPINLSPAAVQAAIAANPPRALAPPKAVPLATSHTAKARKLRDDRKCACGATLRPGWDECAACKRGGDVGHKPDLAARKPKVAKAPLAKVPCERPHCGGSQRALKKHPFCRKCMRSGFERTIEGRAITARRKGVSPVDAGVAPTKPVPPKAKAAPATGSKKIVTLGTYTAEVGAASDFGLGILGDLDPVYEYLLKEKPEVMVIEVPKDTLRRAFCRRLERRLQEMGKLDVSIRQHRVDGCKVAGKIAIVQGKTSRGKSLQTSARKRGAA